MIAVIIGLLAGTLPAIVGIVIAVKAAVQGQFHESGKPLMLTGLAFTLTCPIPFFAFGFLFGVGGAVSAGVLAATMWFILGITTIVSGLVIKVAYLR